MATLLGARDLGLDTQWTFGFVPLGSRAATTHGVVYLDVGGQLAPGVIDHHKGDAPASTADLIRGRPELVYGHLLSHWLLEGELGRIAKGTRWSPRIVTHFNPDWDGIVATHLTMRLVEDGQLPPYAGALAAYAREVDQGRARVDLSDPESFYAPHLCYLIIQHHDAHKHERLIQRGLTLLERVLRDVSAAMAPRERWTPELFSHRNRAATKWREDTDNFAKERERLREEPKHFSEDRERARILERVRLPAADGGEPIEARAFIAAGPMKSALGKYLVRAEGYELSVIPLDAGNIVGGGGDGSAPEPSDDHFPRVIISLDPVGGKAGKRRANLRGLGYRLERAESEELRARHGGMDPRGTVPRWNDGSCDNSDPWYDGRDHDWTIVDGPAVGTVLRYRAIIRILTEVPFWERPLRHGEVALVWTDAVDDDTSKSAAGLPLFDGISQTLKPLYHDSSESNDHAPAAATARSPTTGPDVSWRRRRFPKGTSPDFRIAVVKAGTSGTLEGLIANAQTVATVAESTELGSPAYVFAKVSLVPYPSFAGAIDAQFASLEIGSLATADLEEGREVALFNARALVLQGDDVAPGPDPDLELFLYEAFLNEALLRFSSRLGDAVPDDNAKMGDVDTGEMRADMLRFQARYYQLEVSRRARGRRLFEALVDASRLKEHYAEVQNELERLAEIEQAMADEKSAEADRMMEGVLYVVAVLGVFQTVIAFVTLDRGILTATWFIASCVGILVGAGLVFAVISHFRRRRRGQRVAAGPDSAGRGRAVHDAGLDIT